MRKSIEFDVNDIINKQFGKLIVVKFFKKERYRNRFNYFYECKCECGNIKIVSRISLITFHTNSCGCLHSKQGNENKGWRGSGEISGAIWSHIKRHANTRNLSFNVTIEEAWQLFLKQNRRCALTGQELKFNSDKKTTKNRTASLDRIDSNKGYEIENIQWVHKDINQMKSALENNKFIELCELVSENQRKKHVT
jgi:hypothetical protein